MAKDDPYKTLAEALPMLGSVLKLGVGVASQLVSDLVEEHGDKIVDAVTGFLAGPDAAPATEPVGAVAHRSEPPEGAIRMWCQENDLGGHWYWVTGWRNSDTLPLCPFTAGEHADMAMAQSPADAEVIPGSHIVGRQIMLSSTDGTLPRVGWVTAVSRPSYVVRCAACPGEEWAYSTADLADSRLGAHSALPGHQAEVVRVQEVTTRLEGMSDADWTWTSPPPPDVETAGNTPD